MKFPDLQPNNPINLCFFDTWEGVIYIQKNAMRPFYVIFLVLLWLGAIGLTVTLTIYHDIEGFCMGFGLSFVGILVGVLAVRICLETCLSILMIRDTVYSVSKEALQKLIVREEEKQSERSESYTEESYEDSIYSDEEV